METVEHEDLRQRKETVKDIGKESQNLAIFIYLGVFKIIPTFCADNLEQNAGIQSQPTGGKRNQEYQHQFLFVVFK